MSRKVRILLDGLTHGGMVHRSGSVVDADARLTQFAEGETLLGHKVAEWIEDERQADKPADAPVLAQPEAPVDTSGPNKPAEAEAELEVVDYDPFADADAVDEPEAEEAADEAEAVSVDEMLFARIRAGQSKGAIIEELGAREDLTQRGLLGRWQELVEAGRIVAGERRGDWSVAE